MAISELNEYISNLRAKHGKLREFSPKTCFDPTKNFDLDKIFLDPSGEGKPPCKYQHVLIKIEPLRLFWTHTNIFLAKMNEVPKIPPLVKPPNRGNRLPDIIAKAKEMVGPKDKKKVESDDDRSSVGSVNGKILDFSQQKIILAVPFLYPGY